MTPEEKAEELVLKFEYAKKYSNSNNAMSKQLAKQCALIAVDEILSSHLFDLDEKEYWVAVKQEIENL